MSRWRVFKDSSYPRQWVARNTGDYSDFERFATHAGAISYADHCARTIEVTLPCPDKEGYIVTTDEHIAWENTEFESNFASVAWIEEPGTIGLSTASGDHYMTTDGARSIATALLALAALAEQEGVK